ncbi:hypothetical protein GCM10010441_59400 [Kitasatospora paracochleata]|uniref:hypothetical protein n=1 Tax=Kitasatospora paracochleata TaxID=58354 RepID=UPI0031E364FF
MAGTIVVHAEPPGMNRARTLAVVVDGVAVGEVRQGDTARFEVPAGTRAVRVVAKDRTGSNTVPVEVAEGRDCRVTARGTGLGATLLLPLVAGFAVPPIFAVVTIMVVGAVLYAVPGLLFRVRAEGDAEPGPAVAPPGPAAAAAAEPGAGLWWESDPALAKRFAKRSES